MDLSAWLSSPPSSSSSEEEEEREINVRTVLSRTRRLLRIWLDEDTNIHALQHQLDGMRTSLPAHPSLFADIDRLAVFARMHTPVVPGRVFQNAWSVALAELRRLAAEVDVIVWAQTDEALLDTSRHRSMRALVARAVTWIRNLRAVLLDAVKQRNRLVRPVRRQYVGMR